MPNTYSSRSAANLRRVRSLYAVVLLSLLSLCLGCVIGISVVVIVVVVGEVIKSTNVPSLRRYSWWVINRYLMRHS